MKGRKMKINIELSDDEALAFAQFLKRLRFDISRSLATNDNEAWLMMSASEAIRKGLAESGISPR